MGANAQTSVPTFTAGDVLTAANMNISARTGVPVFATTVTRDAAFGGTGEKTLAEGQMCYIEAAPKRLQVYNGTAWIDFDAEFTTFTPTFTAGYTRGNGTSDCSYVRIGKLVVVYIREVLGSTSSVTGSIIMTLPITSVQYHRGGTVAYRDPGLQSAQGFTDIGETASQAGFYALSASGSYVRDAALSSTVPFTWAAGDEFYANLIYRAA